jgi:5-methyltetrahydropteroyltriglutamate--homocysteine methyltransferase
MAKRAPIAIAISPFSNDTSTGRDTAFAKTRARVLGTKLAEKLIGGDL